jgi:NodT family efflux transporter outer membrane factor (OMF) lipoprotein
MRRTRTTRGAFNISMLVGLAGLASCKVGPNYDLPKTEAPQQWASALEAGESARKPEVDLRTWWSVLNDPTLDGLIARALENNYDLSVAKSRVLEARALRGIAAADQFPSVNADGSYSRSRNSDNGVGQRAGGSTQPSGGVDNFQVGFDASWELDFFGRVRRNVEASDAQLESTVESLRNVQITLISDVALAYTDLRAFQRRVAIAQDNAKSQQETVNLSKARLEAGLSSELDLARATALLASTQAAIAPLEAGVRTSMYQIAVLVGRQPGALVAELSPVRAIPGVPGDLPVGMPSELLRRRPDVRSAERTLAQQTALVGVATGDLFPRFSLTGSFGFNSERVGNLVDMNSRYWSVGPAFAWNVFDAGKIRNNIKAQEARTQQALALYQKQVLVAFQDVENAMVNYAREQDRLAALKRGTDANQRAVDLSNQLYTRGLTDFFSVLDSQRQLFQTQDDQVQSERNVTADLIALYKALGGGWDPNEKGGSTSFDTAQAIATPQDAAPSEKVDLPASKAN